MRSSNLYPVTILGIAILALALCAHAAGSRDTTATGSSRAGRSGAATIFDLKGRRHTATTAGAMY